jgi:hypothetical protein
MALNIVSYVLLNYTHTQIYITINHTIPKLLCCLLKHLTHTHIDIHIPPINAPFSRLHNKSRKSVPYPIEQFYPILFFFQFVVLPMFGVL